MGFGQAISYNLSNMTNFSGRAARSEFWWWILGLWIFQFVVALLFGGFTTDSGLIAFIGRIIHIILILATLAVGARRLHDTGKSGWWQLLYLIPCIGVIILIVFWATPGNPADNTYGAPPTS